MKIGVDAQYRARQAPMGYYGAAIVLGLGLVLGTILAWVVARWLFGFVLKYWVFLVGGIVALFLLKKLLWRKKAVVQP